MSVSHEMTLADDDRVGSLTHIASGSAGCVLVTGVPADAVVSMGFDGVQYVGFGSDPLFLEVDKPVIRFVGA